MRGKYRAPLSSFDTLFDIPLLLFVTAVSVMVSLVSKWLSDSFLSERIAIVGSFAGLEPTQNSGIAFGIVLPGSLQDVTIVLALVLVAALALRTAKVPLEQIGFGLIVGGALGNIFDRIRDGFVTDFFQVGTFPVFNVADSCITIGVILLLAEMMRKKRNM
ncbi:MAG: signal peptidase II [Patescibacteria group bacterium]